MGKVLRKGSLIALLTSAVLGTVWDVRAQTATTIDFIVPDTTPITPSGTVDAGDILVFTGRSSGVSSTGTCIDPVMENRVQSGIVIDPGDHQRATRLSGIITLDPPTQVPPGTKLGNLMTIGLCSANGVAYGKYRGTVQ